jgi:DnaJ-class molecular chaperone
VAFDVLGIPAAAKQPIVTSRYRALAKEWHPDRFAGDATKANDALSRMTQINIAYAVICRARGWA